MTSTASTQHDLFTKLTILTMSTPQLLVLVSLLSQSIVSGAKCLACSRKDVKCVTEYQLPFLIDIHVCENIRSHQTSELELCKRYPEGYQLQCEMNNLAEINCKLPCASITRGAAGRRRGNGSHSFKTVVLITWPVLGLALVLPRLFLT